MACIGTVVLICIMVVVLALCKAAGDADEWSENWEDYYGRSE